MHTFSAGAGALRRAAPPRCCRQQVRAVSTMQHASTAAALPRSTRYFQRGDTRPVILFDGAAAPYQLACLGCRMHAAACYVALAAWGRDSRPASSGVCNLCNGAVDFMLDHDREGRFRMAALQSPAGRTLLESCGRKPNDISSIVLVEPEQHYIKSCVLPLSVCKTSSENYVGCKVGHGIAGRVNARCMCCAAGRLSSVLPGDWGCQCRRSAPQHCLCRY